MKIEGVTKGLLLRDWRAFGGILSWGLSLWAVLIWVLLILQHPAAIAVWAVSLTVFCVPTIMAHEIMEGSMEFSLALPPTRRERYLTRLMLLGSIVGGGLLVGLLAYGFNLPQKVWSLFTSSLMTRPFHEAPIEIMLLSFASPLAFFGICYGGVMGHTSRLNAVGMIVIAAIVTAVITFALPSEVVSIILLFVVGVGALVYGYARYQRLEAVNNPSSGSRNKALGPLAALLIIGLMMVGMLLFMWGNTPSSQGMESETFELESESTAVADMKEVDPSAAEASVFGESKLEGEK